MKRGMERLMTRRNLKKWRKGAGEPSEKHHCNFRYHFKDYHQSMVTAKASLHRVGHRICVSPWGEVDGFGAHCQLGVGAGAATVTQWKSGGKGLPCLETALNCPLSPLLCLSVFFFPPALFLLVSSVGIWSLLKKVLCMFSSSTHSPSPGQDSASHYIF